MTGEEFPGLTGLYLSDRYIFARDRVRYVGDPVAGVAAISEEIAEKAVELIEVEYEVLHPVLDPEFGASPEAPLLHPDLHKYDVPLFIFPQPGTNVSNHFKIRKGDTEAAWSQCAAIVERKYRIPHVQHVPIEPHVAVAKVDDKGKITLWGSSQSPFAQRNLIAKALHISQSDVQVIAPFVGGGFGCAIKFQTLAPSGMEDVRRESTYRYGQISQSIEARTDQSVGVSPERPGSIGTEPTVWSTRGRRDAEWLQREGAVDGWGRVGLASDGLSIATRTDPWIGGPLAPTKASPLPTRGSGPSTL